MTDNASNLKHGVAGYVYKRLGVMAKHPAPYFPSTNGSIERLIGTLSVQVRCAAEDDPSSWSKWLQQLTARYNHMRHRGTGYSPFMLHFAYEPKGISIVDAPIAEQEVGRIPERYLENLEKVRSRVEEAAKKGMAVYYGRMASDHDQDPKRNIGEHNIEIGTWVLVKIVHKRKGESKSLGPLYMGPAEVLEIRDHVAKIVYLNNGMIRWRNVSHLKPYFKREGDDSILERFTGPKRRDRDLDADVENEDDGEIVDEYVGMETGLTKQSPLNLPAGVFPDVEEDESSPVAKEEQDAQVVVQDATERHVTFAPVDDVRLID